MRKEAWKRIMKYTLTTIQKSYVICMPKKVMEELGFKVGDRVILKFNKGGIMVCKADAFDVLDAHFEQMGTEMKELYELFKIYTYNSL